MDACTPNSPEAAARIVALATLADGRLHPAAFRLLSNLQVHRVLGLDSDTLSEIVLDVAQNVLASTPDQALDAREIDPRTLEQLMGDVDDPDLRLKVLRLCDRIVKADARISAGEQAVMTAAVEQWGMQQEMFRIAGTTPVA